MNFLKNTWEKAVTTVQSAPTESQFFEQGTLTPQEFVEAGDQLIQVSSMWQWKKAASDKYINSYLSQDPERQYLIMQRVPCQTRIKQLIKSVMIEEKDAEEWVISTNQESRDAEVQVIQGSSSSQQSKEQKKDQGIIYVEQPYDLRYYDLSIVYDQYYLTPRLFLSGTKESGQPLSQDQIFEDIMSEYRDKTVTMEEHPQLGIIQASLHPCKHSDVLQTFSELIKENPENTIGPHMALLIFLQFLSSVIPTIQYDIAASVQF